MNEDLKKRKITSRVFIAIITIIVLLISFLIFKEYFNSSLVKSDAYGIEMMVYFLILFLPWFYFLAYGMFCIFTKELTKIDLICFSFLTLITMATFSAIFIKGIFFNIIYILWVIMMIFSSLARVYEIVNKKGDSKKEKIINFILSFIVLINLFIITYGKENKDLINWGLFSYLIRLLSLVISFILIMKKNKTLKDYLIFIIINLSLFGFFFCYNIHKSLLSFISIISLVINIIFVIYSIIDYYKIDNEKDSNNLNSNRF